MALRWKIPKPKLKVIGGKLRKPYKGTLYFARACVPAYDTDGMKMGLLCSDLKKGKTKATAIAKAKRDLVREVKSASPYMTVPYWKPYSTDALAPRRHRRWR